MDRRRLTPLGIGAAAAVLTVGAILAGVGGDAARRASDVIWPLGDMPADVAVVVIDQAAQDEYGPWPWPRALQADLVNALADAGVSAIGYDVVLPETDEPGAADLGAALGRVPSVVAAAYASVVRGERGVYVGSQPLEPSADVAAAASVGHVVVPADADGTTRTIPMVVQSPEGELVPAFALRVAAGGADAEPIVRPAAVQLGALTVPTEASAAMRVSWSSGLAPGDLISAGDVLAGRVDLAGAIALVGIADATVGDTHVTPLQPGATTPGVVVQAQAVGTILSSAWAVPMAWWMSGLIVLVLGTIAAWAALRLAPWLAVIVAAATLAAYVGAAFLLVPATGIVPDLVRVPLGILGAAVAAGIVRIVREQVARRRATSLFARYVPGGVAARLLAERGEDALEAGTRVHAAVLFCDLRGFTPLAASLDPDEVRRALDLYYAYVCSRIFARSGTVMQFVGDEVFAVFGLPEPLADPAAAARAVADAVVADRGELDSRLAESGLPPLSFGIGVHAGDLVAATVGPGERRQFAVVGDAVNVGSRLCGAALAGEIVASEVVAEGAWPDAGRELLTVKGKDAPIEVVRVRTAARAASA